MQDYISATELAKKLRVNPSTIWRWAKKPDFPKPHKLSHNCVRFDQAAVDAWVAAQQAA
mgnify:CR=1 FL=1